MANEAVVMLRSPVLAMPGECGDVFYVSHEKIADGAKATGAYSLQAGTVGTGTVARNAERFSVKPPKSRESDVVDVRTAELALQDVMKALSAATVSLQSVRADGEEQEIDKKLLPTLNDLGKLTTSLSDFYKGTISMASLETKLYELQTTGLFELMKLGLSNQKLIRKFEAQAVTNKLALEREESQKRLKMAEKAAKGGVLSLVVNWAMGAAQVVTGALKVATGQPQGLIDIAAGMTGITKAILQTIVYCHPDQKGRLQEHIDKLAKAEFMLGIASVATSIVSVGRMVQATKALRGAVNGLAGGEGKLKSLGVTLARAFGKADEAAQMAKSPTLTAAAKLAAKEAADTAMDCAKQLATNLAEEVAKDTVANLQRVAKGFFGNTAMRERFAQMFGQDAIQKMVGDVLMESAKKAAKKAAGKGIDAAVEEIQKEFAKQVSRRLWFAISQAVASQQALFNVPSTVVAAGSSAALPITMGVIHKQQSALQKEINELIRDVMMLNFALEYFRTAVKAEAESQKSMMNDYEAVSSRASQGVREATHTMQKVVGNMA